MTKRAHAALGLPLISCTIAASYLWCWFMCLEPGATQPWWHTITEAWLAVLLVSLISGTIAWAVSVVGRFSP